MEKKLNKEQKQLVKVWEGQLLAHLKNAENAFESVRTIIKGLLEEVFTQRLATLAYDMGIDIEKENWRYDNIRNAFVIVEHPKEVIPSKKKAGKKAGKAKANEEKGKKN
ncbi:MAG: hypothetical protein JRI45_06775 [Deltaproteobacteria bacterium]|nr:hypothetical protein [Deltaproteobacteria bacterium]